MDDARFLSILNSALAESGVDLSAPASPSDPAAVAAWAAFLRRCVSQGISIADPRWAGLEVRGAGKRRALALSPGSEPGPQQAGGETDFRVGLALLMAMLGRQDETS